MTPMPETPVASAARTAAPKNTPPGRLPGRRDVPSSLFTRIFALVLTTVAVAQLITMALLALLADAPPQAIGIAELTRAIEAGSGKGLIFRPVAAPPPHDPSDGPAAMRLEAAIATRLGRATEDIAVSLAGVQDGKFVEIYTVPEGGGPPMAEPALIGRFRIAVLGDDGGWVLIEPKDDGPFDSRERQFLLLFLLGAIAMLPVAWIFAKRLSDPFGQFADAAERLGRDPNTQPPNIIGPTEVIRASDAFRKMQQRLQAYVTDRTQMLAAIAHDLRTPLTRLAFRIESIDDPTRSALASDVAEMKAMVNATMDLAKSESRPSDRQRLELGSLVENVADNMALTGRKVSAEAGETLVVDGDPLALRRLFSNLLENAENYGRVAHAKVWRDGDMAVVDIEDEGPGIPEGEEERVFEPFYRLERSRNRETGGIGLGLAVVRTIARAHGGDVELKNRPIGGLRARVTLPLASSAAPNTDRKRR